MIIVILITRYELGESRCITVIELRAAQLRSNWSLYATVVARKASFTPRTGKGPGARGEENGNGARAGEVNAVSILAARWTFPKNPNYRKVL